MTLADAAKAFAGGEKPVTKARYQKLVGFCRRFGFRVEDVLALCPPDIRAQVEVWNAGSQ